MKLTLQLSAVATGIALLAGCQGKVSLNTDQQKVSYAIGQQIGQNIKSQGIPLDTEVLVASVRDVLTNKPPQMKPEEMQAAMAKLQENMNKQAQAAAEKNLAEGKAFLEKNKTQPGVITTASGLQYQIVTEGAGKKPTAKDVVRVHYRGTLLNGEKFDSSYDRAQAAEFPVDAVIKGWSEAMQLFKVGTKARLFVPAELGYGPNPRPGIPPNSVLVFDVELLDIVTPKK